MIVRQMKEMIGNQAWAEGADNNGDGLRVREVGLDKGIHGLTVFGQWAASSTGKTCRVLIERELTAGRSIARN
jgi:hypothetical protein